MTSRYDSLLLTANTFRITGQLLKFAGVAFIIAAPIVIAVGQSQHWGHTDTDDTMLALWPIATAVVGLWLGIPLVLRGIAQEAQGEALVALADIAVATSSNMGEMAAKAWASRSSRTRSAAVIAAFAALCAMGVIMGGADTMALLSAHERAARFSPGTQVAFIQSTDLMTGSVSWEGEESARAALAAGRRRHFFSGERSTVDGKPLSINRQARGFATLADAPDEYVPLTALQVVDEAAPTGASIVPGSTVSFDVDPVVLDEKDWKGEQQAAAAFFPKSAKRTDEPAQSRCVVARVAGTFFSCADDAQKYAPMRTAHLVEAVTGDPLVGTWQSTALSSWEGVVDSNLESVRIVLTLRQDGTFTDDEQLVVDGDKKPDFKGCTFHTAAQGTWQDEPSNLRLAPAGGNVTQSMTGCTAYYRNVAPHSKPWGTNATFAYAVFSDKLWLRGPPRDTLNRSFDHVVAIAGEADGGTLDQLQ